jgi:hypothetical protein
LERNSKGQLSGKILMVEHYQNYIGYKRNELSSMAARGLPIAPGWPFWTGVVKIARVDFPPLSD